MSQTKKPFFLTDRGVNKTGSKHYLDRSKNLLSGTNDQQFIELPPEFGLTYEKGQNGTITLILSTFSKGERPSYWDLMYNNENGTKSVSMIFLAIFTLGLGAIGQAIYYGLGKMEAAAYARSIITQAVPQETENLQTIDQLYASAFFSDAFDSIMSQDILKSYFETNKLPPAIKVKIGNQTYLVEFAPEGSYKDDIAIKQANIKVFNVDAMGQKQGENPVLSVTYSFNDQKAIDEADALGIRQQP